MENSTKLNEKSYDSQAKKWKESKGLNAMHLLLEKPAMYATLPKDLSGRSVLSIGVGTGEELDEILNRNPASVTAIDLSGKLIEIAKQSHEGVKFIKMDMDHLDLEHNFFDVVYSSLALHYSKDWDNLLSGINKVMKQGAVFVFSTHRPEFWDEKSEVSEKYVNQRGVEMIKHEKTLPGDVDIIFYNHQSTDALKECIEYAGFEIKECFGPQAVGKDSKHYLPELEGKRSHMEKKYRENPIFWIFKIVKK